MVVLHFKTCYVIIFLIQTLFFYIGHGRLNFGTGNRTGDTYEGDFLSGEFHGNGTYLYANGDRFVGGFQFGKKSGLGTLYKIDGETIPGRWRQDQLVSEVKV